jgi:hypothetical protein
MKGRNWKIQWGRNTDRKQNCQRYLENNNENVLYLSGYGKKRVRVRTDILLRTEYYIGMKTLEVPRGSN